MRKGSVCERYLKNLLNGDRFACRTIIDEMLQQGMSAHRIYVELIWPIMVEVDKLYRQERISPIQEAMATRINRSMVCQLQRQLPRCQPVHRRVVIVTADSEQAELGGQMAADLFESAGWECRFLGGTVNHEDVLEFVGIFAPDILLLYGFNGKDAPAVRAMIDRIRKVNAWPNMKIMLSGGVFARAEGLWEEIGADFYAESAAEAVELANLGPKAMYTPQRTIKRRQRAAQQAAMLAGLVAADR